MEPHFHTGAVMFLTVTAYALIGFHGLRLLGMFLAANGHDTASAVIGGLVTFPVPSSTTA